MSQIWRGVSGGIEVLENVNEMADLPDISAIDSEGVWYIESGGFGPDYIAPTNWDSSAGEFTDWFSLFDGRILSDIPDSTIDTFEDYLYDNLDKSLSDYYDEDTSEFSRQQDVVAEGEYALELTGSGGSGIISTSGLPRYVDKGETVQVWLRCPSGSRTGFAFMASGGTNRERPENGYVVVNEVGNDQHIIADVDSGANDKFDTSDDNPDADEFYRYELKYDGTDFSCDIFDSEGNFIETLSLSPNNDRSSTDGIYFGNRDGGSSYYDGVKIL